jgi:hypothetical protein
MLAALHEALLRSIGAMLRRLGRIVVEVARVPRAQPALTPELRSSAAGLE